MYEDRFVSVSDYLHKLHFYTGGFWVYRGHSDVNWKLVPSAGRPEHFSKDLEEYRVSEGMPPFDLSRFKEWRKSASAYSKQLPENNFECLALAQHFGLATRLLDWSSNPLVALFFAVESCSDSEACVYLYAPHLVIDPYKCDLADPIFVCSYKPPPLDKRILVQQGEFTYHPHPNEELVPNSLSDNMQKNNPYPHDTNLIRFLIFPEMKSIIKGELDVIGINRKYLFADLDGLSNYINWGTSSAVKWKNEKQV